MELVTNLDRQDSDESKTYENSVIIHDAPVTISGITGSQSVPANIFRIKSGPSQSSDHNTHDLNHQLSVKRSSKKRSHRRQASVSTLIPRRLHDKMPSLVQFLDMGNLRMPSRPMAINPMKFSHSAPEDDENEEMAQMGVVTPIMLSKDGTLCHYQLT